MERDIIKTNIVGIVDEPNPRCNEDNHHLLENIFNNSYPFE